MCPADYFTNIHSKINPDILMVKGNFTISLVANVTKADPTPLYFKLFLLGFSVSQALHFSKKQMLPIIKYY